MDVSFGSSSRFIFSNIAYMCLRRLSFLSSDVVAMIVEAWARSSINSASCALARSRSSMKRI